MSKKAAFSWVGSLVVAIGSLATISVTCNFSGEYAPGEITREADRMGWAGPEIAAEAFAQIEPEAERFQIVGDEPDEPTKRVVLWELAQQVNGGQHIPTLRQEIGDCVGMSSCNACQFLLAVQAARGDGDWKLLFAPYTYACGRNAPDIGKRRMGNNPSGSTGAWQAAAVKQYGVLPADMEGLPAYSRAVVTQWATRMPEQRWINEGRQRVVRTIARIHSAEKARKALQNYYPVTVASDWGGLMQCPVVGGRLLNRKSGTWQHQMLLCGYDFADIGNGPEALFCCLNQWGATAHGTPPDCAPPGSFWIRAKDVEYMTESGDCWAYSEGLGFSQRLDLNIFDRPAPAEVEDVRRAERKTQLAF